MFDATGVFAGIVVLSVFVLLLDRILDWTEKRLITWRPSQEAEATAS